MIGSRIAVLPKIPDDEQGDVIAPRCPLVEVDTIKLRRSSDLNVAFLGQLTRQCFEKRLTCFHTAARQMPPAHV